MSGAIIIGSEERPLILASQSASRRAMLGAAGVAFRAIPARLDERAVEAGMAGAEPCDIASALAGAKACAAVSYTHLTLPTIYSV